MELSNEGWLDEKLMGDVKNGSDLSPDYLLYNLREENEVRREYPFSNSHGINKYEGERGLLSCC